MKCFAVYGDLHKTPPEVRDHSETITWGGGNLEWAYTLGQNTEGGGGGHPDLAKTQKNRGDNIHFWQKFYER